jgi:translation initiation factor 5B
VHHKEVKAALGVKIAAPGLEKAIAGSRLLVCGEDDDEEELMEEVMQDLKGLEDFFDKSGKGVWVQASTLGSLEALLEFLRSSKIPVRGANIGPVSKRDVTSASSMLQKAPEFAVMLCFDITVDKEARRYAEEQGVKIFEGESPVLRVSLQFRCSSLKIIMTSSPNHLSSLRRLYCIHEKRYG